MSIRDEGQLHVERPCWGASATRCVFVGGEKGRGYFANRTGRLYSLHAVCDICDARSISAGELLLSEVGQGKWTSGPSPHFHALRSPMFSTQTMMTSVLSLLFTCWQLRRKAGLGVSFGGR